MVYLVNQVIFGILTARLNWNWIKFSLSPVPAILHLQQLALDKRLNKLGLTFFIQRYWTFLFLPRFFTF